MVMTFHLPALDHSTAGLGSLGSCPPRGLCTCCSLSLKHPFPVLCMAGSFCQSYLRQAVPHYPTCGRCHPSLYYISSLSQFSMVSLEALISSRHCLVRVCASSSPLPYTGVKPGPREHAHACPVYHLTPRLPLHRACSRLEAYLCHVASQPRTFHVWSGDWHCSTKSL